MKIFVKTLKGSHFEVEVKPDDTVSLFVFWWFHLDWHFDCWLLLEVFENSDFCMLDFARRFLCELLEFC